MIVSGYFYTHNKNAAQHMRFVFYDWLTAPTFDIEKLGRDHSMRGQEWTEYYIDVKDAPTELYDKIAALYVGERAVYPYCCGLCMHVAR